MRNQEEKIEFQKKVHRRICVRNITFWLHVLLLMSFFVVFSSPSILQRTQNFAPENGADGEGGGCEGVVVTGVGGSRWGVTGVGWQPLPTSVYAPVSGPSSFHFNEGYCKFWNIYHT